MILFTEVNGNEKSKVSSKANVDNEEVMMMMKQTVTPSHDTNRERERSITRRKKNFEKHR